MQKQRWFLYVGLPILALSLVAGLGIWQGRHNPHRLPFLKSTTSFTTLYNRGYTSLSNEARFLCIQDNGASTASVWRLDSPASRVFTFPVTTKFYSTVFSDNSPTLLVVEKEKNHYSGTSFDLEKGKSTHHFPDLGSTDNPILITAGKMFLCLKNSRSGTYESYLLDIQTGKQLTLEGSQSKFPLYARSTRDGGQIYGVCDATGERFLWQANTGKRVAADPFLPQASPGYHISSLRLSADEKRWAVAETNGKNIRLTLRPVYGYPGTTLKLPTTYQKIFWMSWNDKDQSLGVVGRYPCKLSHPGGPPPGFSGSSREVEFWDTTSGKPGGGSNTPPGYPNPVTFSPDGWIIFIESVPSPLPFFPPSSRTCLISPSQKRWQVEGDAMMDAGFSPDNKRLIVINEIKRTPTENARVLIFDLPKR